MPTREHVRPAEYGASPTQREELQHALKLAAIYIGTQGRTENGPVQVFTTDAVHLIMENQFISNPSSRIALFGHKQDTEILQKASEHSQCAMIPTLGDKWLQSPEFYGLNDTLRDTLIEESLAQNLIIVETPELKVYALPVFFSFRWISSPNVPYIKDEIMDFLALILNRYLQFKQEYYLDVKDVMDGLGRYRFQWDNRLYDDLNESYFRMYKVQDVIRNIA